ncbi:MAG: SDR family oxidoreductase [Ardenticatenaceae bacterium]|nr:SDR family oxidoreductase [Ardenticatenaceae bacterium]
MDGKVCIVTGANAGIGLATAVGLAELGATVVMVCRSQARGEAALQEVQERTGNDAVHLLLADLASLAEVRQVAATFKQQFDRLDVLINNAAVITLKREETVDGLERQFAVNHLAPFLLTNLLLDALKASAPSRIVNVSSGVHAAAQIDFADLQSNKRYRRSEVYGRTKLMNVLFTKELARRLAGSGVTANALHPGVPATKLSKNYSGREMPASASFAKLQEAAQTSIYLATSPEVAGVSGKYFANSRERDSSIASQDVDTARRLWEVSAQLTNL